MLEFYPLLIECAIDFKIESRKVLAARNGKLGALRSPGKRRREISNESSFVGVELVIDESVETCTVAEGYSIVKHED